MDASADIDAPMQESKQGAMIMETVFCGLRYIILKLGEFRWSYSTCFTCSALRFSQFLEASADIDNEGERTRNRDSRDHSLLPVPLTMYVCNILIQSVYGCLS